MVIINNHIEGSQQAEIMTTALDLAKTAASFASDTTAIESLVYQLHVISESMPPGSFIVPEEENSIFDIYFKLENYLTTADPIRTFNKDELRNKASRSLRARLDAYGNETVGLKKG